MNLKNSGAILGVFAASTLLISACGNSASDSETAKKVEGVTCEGQANLKASGSSAQANAMTLFANSYATTCEGKTIDYNSNGSGAGVKEFTGGLTNFGGSDSPLKEDEVTAAATTCGSEAWNLPLVFGPIAVTYNLDGVDAVNLSGPTLGKIFNGTIKKWNDPAIAAENSGVSLPDQDIIVIFRSDESGTTDNFQKYLEAASDGTWTQGAGKSFAGGVGEGAKGNEGTSAAIKNSPGSITYNEWSYATNQGLSIANIITSAGPEAVPLSVETVGKTIDGATLKNPGSNNLVLDTSSFYKPSVAGAYPIVLATYEIVCSNYSDDATGQAVKSFLKVAASTYVQSSLEAEGYIPIPEGFSTQLNTAIDSIQ